MPSEKAWHESGHAVAAAVLGVPIKLADVEVGVTTLTRGTDQEKKRSAIIALAGPAAETLAMKYTKVQAAKLMKTAWAQDLKNAKSYIDGQSIGLAMRMARWLVHDNEDAIEMVAKALDERGKLDGDEITALFD